MTDLFEPLSPSSATRRKENTRARLVRASLDVFVDKGIDGATIDDLVTAAGFTRGAFYSNFTKKDEVFYALFESVTDEVIDIVRTSVQEAIDLETELAAGTSSGAGAPGGAAPARGTSTVLSLAPVDEATVMVGVFEAIRPYGRQWYLLYSESVAHALRSESALAQLNAQRHRLRDEIALALEVGLATKGETCVIGVDQLAQLLVGVFVDLMVQENLDHADITHFAGESILRVMRAFVVGADASVQSR